MSDLSVTLAEAADTLQRAAIVTTPEQAWFMVGGVAATLKFMALDFAEEEAENEAQG